MSNRLSNTTVRPTWEIAALYPGQGSWAEWDYLALETNQLIELTDGHLELLPMPDEAHQDIVAFIYDAVRMLLQRLGKGVAKQAPFRIRVRQEKFREPDICVLLDEHSPKRGRKFWSGADVVFEIVSPDNPERDYWTKRKDYAEAGIAEYWIVDRMESRVTVLALEATGYRELGIYQAGQRAKSSVMPGFELDVTACFAAGSRAAADDEPRA